MTQQDFKALAQQQRATERIVRRQVAQVREQLANGEEVPLALRDAILLPIPVLAARAERFQALFQ
jgi:hypothetical protein